MTGNCSQIFPRVNENDSLVLMTMTNLMMMMMMTTLMIMAMQKMMRNEDADYMKIPMMMTVMMTILMIGLMSKIIPMMMMATIIMLMTMLMIGKTRSSPLPVFASTLCSSCSAPAAYIIIINMIIMIVMILTSAFFFISPSLHCKANLAWFSSGWRILDIAHNLLYLFSFFLSLCFCLCLYSCLCIYSLSLFLSFGWSNHVSSFYSCCRMCIQEVGLLVSLIINQFFWDIFSFFSSIILPTWSWFWLSDNDDDDDERWWYWSS